jgi:ubiquinone/menaquinone biosynthesis C-methylase UbiE
METKEDVVSSIEHLTPVERARQLRNPDGETGLAVAEYLNANNRQGNARTVAFLDLQPGHRVLEIGFGNGRIVPDVVGKAEGIRYTGIDFSPTMVAEASRFNATLVSDGSASFHLGSAEELPFPDEAFDRVFSTGVIHFWAYPAGPLREARRVLSLDGMMVMGCLASQSASELYRPEYGFHLREGPEWEFLCRDAGFKQVTTETLETDQINADSTPVKRYSLRIMARA